jgi:hypothetical protein
MTSTSRQLSDEQLDAILRRAELAPKIEPAVVDRILAAVTAPGAALRFERLEEGLEQAELAPRVSPSRRAEILDAAMRDGAPLWDRLRDRLRGWTRVVAIAVPVAAAAAVALVVLRPPAEPERSFGIAETPYIGEKGAPVAPVRRFQASLTLARVGDNDLHVLGELRLAEESIRIRRGAELSIVYRNDETKPLYATVGLVGAKSLSLAAMRFRLDAGKENGVFEGNDGPWTAMAAAAGESRLIAVLSARPAKISPEALVAGVARDGRPPADAGLGEEFEIRSVRVHVEEGVK